MTMMRTLPLWFALSAMLASAGCFWVTTKSEGKAIQQDVEALENRANERETELAGKLKELEKVLKEATDLLARNSADLGQEVKGMDSDLRRMRGLLNEVKRYTDDIRKEIKALEGKMDKRDKVYQMRFEDLDKRLVALETKAAGPKDPDSIYKAGKTAFDRGAFRDARVMFKRLVVRFPTHKLADDAQYYRAESYMKEKSYEDAIREFQKIFDKYAKSSFADDAFFRAGEAAEKLKNCREARAYYNALRSKYKKSKLAKKAAARDKFLKKNAKKKKVCRR